MRNQIQKPRPSVSLLESEIGRLKYQIQYRMLIKSTVCTIMTLAAAAVLAVTLWFPVLQVYGNSMSPTLRSGDVLLCVKTENVTSGDITAFYHSNKILVKRVIGCAGDRVELDEQGVVSINGTTLSESYIEASLGTTDIPLPCQVPNGSFFMMGDNRTTSVDSRNSTIGCVPGDRILGKVLLRIWPLHRFGIISQKGG